VKRETRVNRGAAALLGKRRVLGEEAVSADSGRAGETAGLFERPAELFPCCPTRADHRSFRMPI